jgi:hypothetical protein
MIEPFQTTPVQIDNSINIIKGTFEIGTFFDRYTSVEITSFLDDSIE